MISTHLIRWHSRVRWLTGSVVWSVNTYYCHVVQTLSNTLPVHTYVYLIGKCMYENLKYYETKALWNEYLCNSLGRDFIIKELPSVLILTIADQRSRFTNCRNRPNIWQKIKFHFSFCVVYIWKTSLKLDVCAFIISFRSFSNVKWTVVDGCARG